MKLSLMPKGIRIASAIILSTAFVSSVFAATSEDTRLKDMEASGSTATPDFRVKQFNSCQDAKSAIADFLKSYYKKHPYTPPMYYGHGDVLSMEKKAAVPTAQSTDAAVSVVNGPTTGVGGGGGNAKDFSQTNVQIAGVDESEAIKTDGKNIYYYNETDRAIYIVSGAATGKTELIRKIAVPESYASPELFVADGKLTVVASKYDSSANMNYYWYNRAAKTAVIVYDLSDLDKLSIERYYQIDGTLQSSRRIGDYLYVVSNSSFAFPYQTYMFEDAAKGTSSIDEKKFANDITIEKIMPKVMEIVKTASTKDANYRGQYNAKSGNAAECQDIDYVLPDEKTMESYDFSPSITNITAISLKNSTEKAKTQVLFGDVGEIMLSQNALYVTSQLYFPANSKCPIYARCFAPSYFGGHSNTLVHRFGVSAASVKYDATAVVPGMLMNRYAMDESDGKFRIVTQEDGIPSNPVKSSTSRYSRVSILDAKTLVAKGTLDKIAENENFQSARFIGNRLYLVTFQQIDPLFVIDVSTDTPKILGELKMPGYSTYLHPYSEGKLIGIGYDTKTNQWGGTQNAGIKVDLYDVSDVKNPKQIASKTFGDANSSSDALHDPRLFVWNATRKLLTLPVTLMTSANDTNSPYRSKDVFQGILALNIDEAAGIKEVTRISHLNTGSVSSDRTKECKEYSKNIVTTPPKCEKLLGGGEYCPSSTPSYVPPYCYESATDNEYLADHIWSYNNQFIKRSVYLDNHFYAVSDVKITAHDMNTNFSKE